MYCVLRVNTIEDVFLLQRLAFVAVDKRAAGAVEDEGTSAAGVAFQDLVAAEELGGLREIAAHRIGLRWVGGIDIDGCWMSKNTIVVM